tara:strand:+ start:306 stop:1193 length:888 start_codon:yes stop_codon:yes gene_type:complete
MSFLTPNAWQREDDDDDDDDDENDSDDDDVFVRYDAVARRVPAYVGTASLLLLLLNRAVSNVAPTLNAASAQSRADVIDVVMSATLILTGLTLVSIAPRTPETVVLDGHEVNYIDDTMHERCKNELLWAGKTLREASKCASVSVVEVVVVVDDDDDDENNSGTVVFYDGTCCAKDAKVLFENRTRRVGSVCKEVLTSGKQNYMANANLFPGRFEFIQDDQEMLSFRETPPTTTAAAKGFGLPQNSQAICCVAIGDKRLLVVSADRQRGFTKVDQAWFELVAQKLDNAFSPREMMT